MVLQVNYVDFKFYIPTIPTFVTGPPPYISLITRLGLAVKLTRRRDPLVLSVQLQLRI